MKKLALLLLALIIALPAVSARASSYAGQNPSVTRTPIAPQMSLRSQILYNASLSKHGFGGLGGIYGQVSPPEPEEYGPAKPFGRPRLKRATGLARLPSHYVPLGGTANATPGISRDLCAQFQCKPGENVVADTVAKKYYRCYCATAGNIKPENRKCFDTPGVAEKIGYKAGPC